MRTTSGKRGFSFVEIQAAIFVVVMVALIVAASIPLASQARRRAYFQMRATGIVQRELESIKSLGYSNADATQLLADGLIDSTTPVATNTYTFNNVDTAAFDTPANNLPSGTGQVLIEQVSTDLRRVTVSVTWTDRGRTRTIRSGTLLANL